MVKLTLRLALLISLIALFAIPAHAQNAAVRGWCETGNTPVVTSGQSSFTLVQVSYPSCTVTVFIHGGGLATGLTSDAAGTQPLLNPFNAQTNGQYMFYMTPGQHIDVQLSGGLPFPGFPNPVVLSDIIVGGNSPPPTASCSPTGAAGNLLASNGIGGCQPTNLVEAGTALTVNDSTTFTQPLTANLLATFNNLLGIGPNASYYTTFTTASTLAPNSLVKLLSNGQVIPTAAGDTIGIIGVYVDSTTAGAGSAVHVATFGPASILIDSSGCTNGAAIINSPSTPGAGRCTLSPGTAQIIGQANATLSGTGVTPSFIYPYIVQNAASSGGGGGGAGNPGGTNTQLQYNNNGVFAGTRLTYQPLQFSPINPAITACFSVTALPCDVYRVNAYQNLAGFTTGNVIQILTPPLLDTRPSRGNSNGIYLSSLPSIAFGTTLAIYSAATPAPINYPGTILPGIVVPATGLISQTTALGQAGSTSIARGAILVATDDFNDPNSGQFLTGVYAGIGLSKLAGSINTGVGVDVVPIQSYAQDGTGNCCLSVTETAQNLYGIRIGDFGGFATQSQAGILIQPQTTPNAAQAYSIWVQAGGRPALFSDGIADSTLTVGQCVGAGTVGGIIRLISVSCGGGSGTPGGGNGQFQYNNAGAFGGTPGFTFNNSTGSISQALGNISTDINPFAISWTTTNGAQVYNGFKISVTNSGFANGSVNFAVCGGPASTNCFTIDPGGNVSTPGSFATGSTGAAGNFLAPQGALPSFTIGGVSYTNSFMLTAPTSIPTNYQWVVPGAAAAGVMQLTLGSNLSTISSSGDANHARRGTAQTAGTGTLSLCLAANCPAGEYEVHLHLNSTVTCATPGPATITPTLTFTDDAGAKSAIAMPLVVNGGTTLATTMALGNTTNWSYAVSPHFWSSGAQPIQFAIGYTGCTSGTGTYSYSAEAVQLQ